MVYCGYQAKRGSPVYLSPNCIPINLEMVTVMVMAMVTVTTMNHPSFILQTPS